MRKVFTQTIPPNASVLEIGPFYNPQLRGDNVKYFEILSQEELKKRAIEIGQQQYVSNVPYINYVSKTADLTIIQEKFDAVFSCHVIEHQLDFIDHLNKVSSILNEGGKYYLIVPDKRFCFDHYNNTSSIADIIAASYEKKQKHSIKNVIEHRALTTHNVPSEHWAGRHGDITPNHIARLKQAIAEYETGNYVDVHAWCFTDHSFHVIVNTLNALDMVDLEVEQMFPTQPGTFEFFSVLKKRVKP